MKRLAESLFGLQKGERGTALLLAAYHFLLLLCLYPLKPVRDGLFITDRGTAELPLVFMLVAVATVPAGLGQRWLGRHYAHDRLTNRLTVGLVVVLLTVSGLAWAGVPGGAYAVYVYVSIYGVLATSQFWLFAGGLLTSAQSKRTFALLNLGGILGAVMGGELTGWLVHHLEAGAGAVLSIAAGLLLATVPLMAGIRRYHASTEGGAPEPSAEEGTLNPEPSIPSSDRSPAAGRETAIQHGARYVLVSQLLALKTGGDPPSTDTVDRSGLLPESKLRAQRRAALDALFDVLADWVPEAREADATDLRLALEVLHQSSDDVRSDAVSFLDGVLSGVLRRRLVPLLDDPDGHLALQNAPPVYRFAIPEFTPRDRSRFACVPAPNQAESAGVCPLPSGGPERRGGDCGSESEGRPLTRTMRPGSRS
ncbi:MAG: hypothetical protein ABEL51_13230 [Salinibacter sp.]